MEYLGEKSRKLRYVIETFCYNQNFVPKGYFGLSTLHMTTKELRPGRVAQSVGHRTRKSAEHEIFPADISKNANDCWHFNICEHVK